MKFAKYLAAESVPEWRRKYLNYKFLKKILKIIERNLEQNQRRASQQYQQQLNRRQSLLNSVPPPPALNLDKLQPTEINRKILPPQIDVSKSQSLDKLDQQSQRSSVSRRSSIKNFFTLNKSLSFSLKPQRSAQLNVSLQSILVTKSDEEKRFFQILDDEFKKINDFYEERENEALVKLETLKNQVKILEEQYLLKSKAQSDQMNDADQEELVIINGIHTNIVRQTKSNQSAKNRLKDAILEFYRYLELLKNYKILNYTGFVKILKKFDKTAQWQSSQIYMQKVDASYFHKSKIVDNLLKETEDLFVDHFAKGDKRSARQQLRIPDQKQITHHGTTWRVGLYIGLSIPVIISSIIRLSDPAYREDNPTTSDLVSIFAGFSLPIFFMFLIAANQYIWSTANINYKFIFEFDPRDNLNYHQFLEPAGILLLLWSYAVFLTFVNPFEQYFDIHNYYPLIFFILVLVLLFSPVNIFYWSSRKWLIKTLFRLITAPRYPVEFRDFFIGDELNSLVYSVTSLQLFFCVYINDFQDSKCNIGLAVYSPAINMLPAYFRFMQCLRRFYDTRLMFPHLANAGKYSATIITTWLSSTYFRQRTTTALVFWILSSIVATVYAYSWDIFMDWGLGQKNSRNKYLRDDLGYEKKWVYYFAMVADLFLRISWLANVSVGVWGQGIDNRGLLYALALLEIFRRFMWNFFRLENEHLNNCGQFRAVKEIPLPFQIIQKTDESEADLNKMENGSADNSENSLDDLNQDGLKDSQYIHLAKMQETGQRDNRDYETRKNIESRRQTISRNKMDNQSKSEKNSVVLPSPIAPASPSLLQRNSSLRQDAINLANIQLQKVVLPSPLASSVNQSYSNQSGKLDQINNQ